MDLHLLFPIPVYLRGQLLYISLSRDSSEMRVGESNIQVWTVIPDVVSGRCGELRATYRLSD